MSGTTMSDPATRGKILLFQKTEITEYFIYQKLARFAKAEKNRDILLRIARDEQRHASIWQGYTKIKLRPRAFFVWFYPALARILGLTFAVKLMEKGEERAQHGYQKVIDQFPETKQIFDEENRHEHELIQIIQEEKLNYLGSIVLGLSDALVELTGALAGLSFALQNTKLIALAGLVTGIAASMSMAGSEYLSKKAEQGSQPAKSAAYTGIAYITAVILLVLPFLIFTDYRRALPITLTIALLIIFTFTFFSATVQDLPFRKKFFEMALITFGVALLSFFIGIALRAFFNIDV